MTTLKNYFSSAAASLQPSGTILPAASLSEREAVRMLLPIEENTDALVELIQPLIERLVNVGFAEDNSRLYEEVYLHYFADGPLTVLALAAFVRVFERALLAIVQKRANEAIQSRSANKSKQSASALETDSPAQHTTDVDPTELTTCPALAEISPQHAIARLRVLQQMESEAPETAAVYKLWDLAGFNDAEIEEYFAGRIEDVAGHIQLGRLLMKQAR